MNQLKKLQGVKIAILVTDGFEESEMTNPRQVLSDTGATITLISLGGSTVKSWKDDKWGKNFQVDKNIKDVKSTMFDALVLPGGVLNPDKLRVNKLVIKFISHFLENEKLVAAICHGPWTLIETGLIDGRTLTSYHSIKTDLINAGSRWINKKVVVDDNLITSRCPDDLPAFNEAIIKFLKTKQVN